MSCQVMRGIVEFVGLLVVCAFVANGMLNFMDMPSWEELQRLRALEEIEAICKVTGQALISLCLAMYVVVLNFQSAFRRNQWNRAHLVVHHQGIAFVYLLMAICAMGGVGGTFFPDFIAKLAPGILTMQTVKLIVAIAAFWTAVFGLLTAFCVEQQTLEQEPARKRGHLAKEEPGSLEQYGTLSVV